MPIAISKEMKLIGKNIVLVPAKETDRNKIFAWLTQSDLTYSMLGEHSYPDHPIPAWEEFCIDYTLEFLVDLEMEKEDVTLFFIMR